MLRSGDGGLGGCELRERERDSPTLISYLCTPLPPTPPYPIIPVMSHSGDGGGARGGDQRGWIAGAHYKTAGH